MTRPWRCRRVVGPEIGRFERRFFLRHVLTLFLTMAILMAGLPTCGCSCRALAGEFDAAAVAAETVGSCSHCTDNTQRARPERRPCQCADCPDQWQTVADAKILVASIQRTAATNDQVNDIALPLCSELSSPGVSQQVAARLGSSGLGRSSCAIPILLGHLLL